MNVLRTISSFLEEKPVKKTPTRWRALVIIILMCDLNDKLESILTPRSEMIETLLRCKPSNKYWHEGLFMDFLRIGKTSCHLLYNSAFLCFSAALVVLLVSVWNARGMHRVVLLLTAWSRSLTRGREVSLAVECCGHAGGWRHRLQRAHAERLQRHGYALFLTPGLLTRGREVRVQRECARSIKRIFTQALLSVAAYCTMARLNWALFTTGIEQHACFH